MKKGGGGRDSCRGEAARVGARGQLPRNNNDNKDCMTAATRCAVYEISGNAGRYRPRAGLINRRKTLHYRYCLQLQGRGEVTPKAVHFFSKLEWHTLHQQANMMPSSKWSPASLATPRNGAMTCDWCTVT